MGPFSISNTGVGKNMALGVAEMSYISTALREFGGIFTFRVRVAETSFLSLLPAGRRKYRFQMCL